MKMRYTGIAAVIGGILIHLTLGSLISFGNIMTYMASFMHVRVDDSIEYGNFTWVLCIAVATQGSLMVLGGLLEKRIGPKLTCFIGCSIMSFGIMLTYYSIERTLFAVTVTYGLLFGIGISLSYVTPLACGMKWYPENKGFVTGVIGAGYSFGAFTSTYVQTAYLNPNNIPPAEDRYFRDPALLDKVPSLFILLGLIFLAVQYIGCLLLNKPSTDQHYPKQQGYKNLLFSDEVKDAENVDSASTDTKRDLKPVEMVKQKTFYVFWFIFFYNTVAVGYISAMYKSFGLSFISDDHFLATVGSLAAIFNAVGRVCWGRLMDKTSFKFAMGLLTLILAVLFATLPLTRFMGKVGFALWIWMMFFTFSGTFVLIPTVIEMAFGSKYYSANFGIIFTCQSIAGPLVALLNPLMLDAVGYTGCFLTIATLISYSFILTFLVPKGL